jgi:hypothetical protein
MCPQPALHSAPAIKAGSEIQPPNGRGFRDEFLRQLSWPTLSNRHCPDNRHRQGEETLSKKAPNREQNEMEQLQKL